MPTLLLAVPAIARVPVLSVGQSSQGVSFVRAIPTTKAQAHACGPNDSNDSKRKGMNQGREADARRSLFSTHSPPSKTHAVSYFVTGGLFSTFPSVQIARPMPTFPSTFHAFRSLVPNKSFLRPTQLISMPAATGAVLLLRANTCPFLLRWLELLVVPLIYFVLSPLPGGQFPLVQSTRLLLV